MKRQLHRGALRLFLLTAVTTLALAVGAYADGSGIITGDVVNARKGPGTGYERVESLAKGKQITILGEENGWYHIKWNDSTGYVLKDYVSLSSSTAAQSSASASANATVVGGDTINVRSGAGTSCSRVTTLGSGKRVAVLSQEGDWYKVSFDGKTGYIKSDYIARDGSTGKQSSASANAAVSGGSSINVRSGPSTSASRIATLAEGKRVAVLSQEGDWYQISFDGKSGYIHKDYVTRDGDAAAHSEAGGNATVKDNKVNVRSAASTSAERIVCVSAGKRVTLLAKADGWYKVSFDGKTGYIYADYITPDSGVLSSLAVEETSPAPQTEPASEPETEAPASEAQSEEETAETLVSESAVSTQDSAAARNGFVTGGTINVRSGPGTEHERVTRVSTGKQVNILAEENGWYKVSFDGTTGYILSDYVYEGDSLPESLSGGVASQVAALAPQYLGVPYVHGGSSPKGFDCSGFTMYLYKQFGYSLCHSASGQYANGHKISKSELRPGDLVFFSSPSSGGSINHTAVYVGNGEIIHARYSVGKVYRNSLSESYYSKYYVGAIRVAD